jgi:UDP-N-acetylglucosamine 2-epimerase (non-hydrolysing)
MGFFDYVKLQKESCCIISDSGTITEESTILILPAITIRQAHERPEGMDEGVLIMSDLDPDSVLNSISIVMEQHDNDKRVFNIVSDYDVNNVSKKVVRIIHSYTGYVNRTVWRKR